MGGGLRERNRQIHLASIRIPRSLTPPLIALAVALVGGLARIHRWSVGFYEYLADPTRPSSALWGAARQIRSDEWLVRTPWVLRQAETGFSRDAFSGVGTTDVGILYDLPVRGWHLLLRPQTLGYLIGPVEFGFALEWWLLNALAFSGVYLLLWKLTRIGWLSVLGSLVFLSSPVVQWWADPIAFVIPGAAALAAALLLHAAEQEHARKWRITAALSGWFVAIAMAALYPPWLLGVAVVMVSVLVGWIVAPDAPSERRARGVRLTGSGVIGAVVAAILLAPVLISSSADIRAQAATVYPGQRAGVPGGGVEITALFGAPFDSLGAALPIAVVNGSNTSVNASGLVLILPVLLALLATSGATGPTLSRTERQILVAASSGAGVLLAWMLLPIPSSLGRLLLFDRIPPARFLFPLALASTLTFVVLAAALHRKHMQLSKSAGAAIAGTFLFVHLWVGSDFSVNAQRPSLRWIVLLAVLVSVAVLLVLQRRVIVGMVLLTAFALWQSSLINPVQAGIPILLDSDIRSTMLELADAEKNDTTWLVIADWERSPLLRSLATASGIRALPLMQSHPDRSFWSLIDDDRQSEEIWNRWAHVAYADAEPGQPPALSLTANRITLELAVCDERFDQLAVTRVLSDIPLDAHPCLDPVGTANEGQVTAYFYRRSAP